MKTHALPLFAALLCLALCRAGAAQPRLPAPEEGRPVTQALPISIPGKISHVCWMIQTNLCVLDICFPGTKDSEPPPEHPLTQVWLLKADGTMIPKEGGGIILHRPMGDWGYDNTAYTFPLSAKTEACAVVVRVGEQCFVEPLSPIAR